MPYISVPNDNSERLVKSNPFSQPTNSINKQYLNSWKCTHLLWHISTIIITRLSSNWEALSEAGVHHLSHFPSSVKTVHLSAMITTGH